MDTEFPGNGEQRDMLTSAVPLDPESEQIREVYAWYGLAMYLAQCLERELAMVLSTKYGPGPTKITRGQFDDLLESMFSKTLGQLVRDIRELANLSEYETEQLQVALDTRNWLAHRYFWERAVDFMSESGRESMIEEIQEAAHAFQTLDELFTKKTLEWGEPYGFTQERLDQEVKWLTAPSIQL